MEMNTTDIPFLSNIGLMMTYRCSVACPHCVVEAGPHRKEGLSLDQSLSWISEAAAYQNHRIQGLALTGGEPFLDIEHLKKASRRGKELGFIVSVVTNAFWASSREGASAVLSELPDVDMISLSTDAYHLKCIPFDNIINGILAVQERGLRYNVAICTDNEEDLQYQMILDDLMKITDAEHIRTAITFPVGRAERHAKHFKYRKSAKPTVSACTMASSPVIFPEGKIMACIGPVMKLATAHPLALGNLFEEPLSSILDRAEENIILHAVRVWGPHRLVSILRDHGLERLLPAEYIEGCICDICFKLLSKEEVLAFLRTLSAEDDFRRKIAYGRLYYLNEDSMANALVAEEGE